MGTASQTKRARLGIGAADPVTFGVNYSDFDPGVEIELIDTNETAGTFDKYDNRVVQGRTMVRPRLSTQPTAAELAQYLAWGMYGTPTGTPAVSYPLGDDPVPKFVHFAPRVGGEWVLGGVVVSQFVLSAATGQALRFDAQMTGQTADGSRSDFPAGVVVEKVTRPFVMNRLVLTVNGVARKAARFAFTVNHAVDQEVRFFNSDTLTDLVKLDQEVSLAVDVPSGDNAGLWNAAQSGGVSASAVFTTGGGGTLTITFGTWRFRPRSPVHATRAEGMLTLDGEAYVGTSGRPVAVTLDATG